MNYEDINVGETYAFDDFDEVVVLEKSDVIQQLVVRFADVLDNQDPFLVRPESLEVINEEEEEPILPQAHLRTAIGEWWFGRLGKNVTDETLDSLMEVINRER